MTLDEWKKMEEAKRLKSQFKLRRAGEGVDASQWKTGREYRKSEGDEESAEEEEESEEEEVMGLSIILLSIVDGFSGNLNVLTPVCDQFGKKTLINCVFTTQLICTFFFAFQKSSFLLTWLKSEKHT